MMTPDLASHNHPDASVFDQTIVEEQRREKRPRTTPRDGENAVFADPPW
jgi:hypothetical protein